MKKNLIVHAALASLASLCGVAQAQSNVAVYGNIDQYIGYMRSSSGDHVTGLNDGSIVRSRLGFRGTEDLGKGYQVKFTLEQGINADSGTQGDSNRLFDRQAWVGITTPAGEFRIGRQNTVVFFVGGAIDYTERTTFGSIVNTFGVPSRYDNDVSYKSPRWAGFQFDAHYALPENGVATRGNSGIRQVGLDYLNGPYRVGYAGLVARPNAVTATVDENIEYHNFYANYAYSAGKLYAVVIRSNNVTANANGLNAGSILSGVGSPNNFFPGTDVNARRFYNVYQVSADYRLSERLRIGALLGKIDDTSGGHAGAKGGNVGAYYEMSKRTTLYSFASYLSNEEQAGFRFSGSAAPSANLAGNAVNGKNLTGFQAGILHRF